MLKENLRIYTPIDFYQPKDSKHYSNEQCLPVIPIVNIEAKKTQRYGHP